MGYGRQFIFIFPKLRTVIAFNSNHDTDMGIRNSNRFIENYLPLFLEKEDANE